MCQPERAEPPFHSRCKPPPSAPKPTCLLKVPWLGQTTLLRPTATMPHPDPALSKLPVSCLRALAHAVPCMQSAPSHLPEPELTAPSAGGSASIALVQQGGGNGQSQRGLANPFRERQGEPTPGRQRIPWDSGIILPKGPFGALTPKTSGRDPAGKQGLHREN